MSTTNPIFTDNPIAAVALAEAVGELTRPLDWARPEPAAALRLARGLLEEIKPPRDGSLPRWYGDALYFPTVRAGKTWVSLVFRRDPSREVLVFSIRFWARGRRTRSFTAQGAEGAASCTVRLSIVPWVVLWRPSPKVSVVDLEGEVSAGDGTPYADAIAEMRGMARRALNADIQPLTTDRQPLTAGR